MTGYKLSNKADQDLDEIYSYSFVNFGPQQADKYYDSLLDQLDKIASNPARYPVAQDVKQGIRRSVHDPHTIYYQQITGGVEIIRILRQQDVSTALP
jgi:toxin ParE1/3/4